MKAAYSDWKVEEYRDRFYDEMISLESETCVVVVAHNSGIFLINCVEAINNTAPGVEIIVMDNASTDGSIERLMEVYPDVFVIASQQNLGYGKGCNLGAAFTDREYLVFVNPDLVVAKGWHQNLVSPLASYPSIGLITSKVMMGEFPELINVSGLNVHLSGISTCRGVGQRQESLTEWEEVSAISGVIFAVRREVFELLGGFDEDYFLYMEDVDLSLRTWAAGYRCVCVPYPCGDHYYTFSLDRQRVFFLERGRYLLLLKLFSKATLFSLLPVLVLSEVLSLGWLFIFNFKGLQEKFKAWIWVKKHWSLIKDKHREVQAKRVLPDASILNLLHWRIDVSQLLPSPGAEILSLVLSPVFKITSWLTKVLTSHRRSQQDPGGHVYAHTIAIESISSASVEMKPFIRTQGNIR